MPTVLQYPLRIQVYQVDRLYESRKRLFSTVVPDFGIKLVSPPLPSYPSVTHQMRSVSRERPKFPNVFHHYCGTLIVFTRSFFHGICSTFRTSCGSCEVLPRDRRGLTIKSTGRHRVTGFNRSDCTKDARASKMSLWASCSSDELLWSRMLRRCTACPVCFVPGFIYFEV